MKTSNLSSLALLGEKLGWGFVSRDVPVPPSPCRLPTPFDSNDNGFVCPALQTIPIAPAMHKTGRGRDAG
jgi:hypothetical protein